VHKGSIQTNKRSKLGFKRKKQKKPKRTMVWRTGLSGVPPDSVRCTRAVRLRTLHLRVSEAALRYNSLDCPVCHRTVQCTSGATASQRNDRLQRSPATLQCANSSCRSQSSRQRRTRQCTVPVWCDTGLFGATRRQSSNDQTLRLGDVAGAPDSVRWRIGLSGAPIDSIQPQWLNWWLRVINTPNHLFSNHPSIQHSPFNTRAKCNTLRHKSKPPIRSKSPN
jgi:hypothetical protein